MSSKNSIENLYSIVSSSCQEKRKFAQGLFAVGLYLLGSLKTVFGNITLCFYRIIAGKTG